MADYLKDSGRSKDWNGLHNPILDPSRIFEGGLCAALRSLASPLRRAKTASNAVYAGFLMVLSSHSQFALVNRQPVGHIPR